MRFRLFRWGLTYGAVSAFALIGTAPLTAFHFNQISLAGLVANLFVIPLLGSAAVILGLLTVVGFLFDTRIAILLLWLAGLTVRAGNSVVAWFAALPYASVEVVTPSVLELLLVYAVLLCLCCRSLWSPRVFRVLMSVLLLGLLLDETLWISHRYFHSTLRVSFLDIGQGDAAVVELPDGQVMVIDGGGFASEDFDTGEAILAPFLRSQKIGRVDILVMSHPQLDHYGGLLYLAEHFSPRELWFNGEQSQGSRFVKLMEVVSRKGIMLRTLCRESLPLTYARVSLQILHPPCSNNGLDTNNASLVLRLSYGATSLLFTGDIEAEGESVLRSSAKTLASEILKVPHHGSRTSSSLEFIEAIAPTVAIASLGANNRFHFPAEEVVQRYQRQGSRLLRTDQAGTVTVSSDGHNYSLSTTLFGFLPRE
jgi:competence protein ComEC